MFGGDLLGWLTGGSDLGMGGGMLPPGMYPGGGNVPMPPVQQTGADMVPPVPPMNVEAMPGQNAGGYPPPTDPATTGGMPSIQGGGPPIPPDPSIEAMPGGQGGPAPAPPMPAPRPAAAGSGPLPPGTPPPGIDLPGVMSSYAKAGGNPMMPPPGEGGTLPGGGGSANSQGPIARALGLSPEVSNRLARGMAAGLKAAGNSSGKSAFQALTSGAGEAMDGQNKSDDNEYGKKLKYHGADMADKATKNKEDYNNNYLKYLNAKLKADQDKAAGGSTGKSGAWNKPDSQKFLDTRREVSRDPDIKASLKVLESVLKTGSQADVAKAQADHAKLVADKQNEYASAVGLDPAKLAFNLKNPPGSPPTKGPDGKTVGGNPHIVTSRADFDTYVKPGQAYINPKDNQIYIRKGGDNKGGADSKAAAPATPSMPPLPPGLPPMMPGQGLPTSSDDYE
jgi:hypothetical protein